MEDHAGMNEYLNIVHHCFDVYLSMAILRLDGGCDFSKLIAEQQKLVNLPPDNDVIKESGDDEEEISMDGS